MSAALTLDRADGAFETLEAFLTESGFWGRSGVVADLYLGYGLASRIRRADAPSPPEPCCLPLLSCRVRAAPTASATPGGRYAVGVWERTWDDAAYANAIESVRCAIARGDVYQTNLVQHLSAPFRGDPLGLVGALAPLRPLVPHALVADGATIVSASPELFLARRGDLVWTAPIKGTRPAGQDVKDAKDVAEHVMIVDLERNDLSRVCVPGSIRWPKLLRQRRLAGVTHLESTIEGRLRSDASFASLLEAMFPGGSITGAPKIAAVDLIAALEPVGRGASMGALGTIYPNGDLRLALTIRTFAVSEGRIHLWVGGGIVWDSIAEKEIEESWVKASPLLAAIGAPSPRDVLPPLVDTGSLRC